jgi:hypothetical protein
MTETKTTETKPALIKYRVVGSEKQRQRIDGQDRVTGDVIEMTEEAASYYLREGRLEAVGETKPARGVAKSEG